MRNSAVVLLCLLSVSSRSTGQEVMPRQSLAGWFSSRPATQGATRGDGMTKSNRQPEAPTSSIMQVSSSDTGCQACSSCSCTACGDNCGGLHWTHDCFPRNACPDDYCPNPYPRQCWPPYPFFYRCVPAGDCAGCRKRTDDLSWWFIPKPGTLREAIGWRP
jgi:hypothetical protein